MPRVSNAFEDYRSFIKPLNKKNKHNTIFIMSFGGCQSPLAV